MNDELRIGGIMILLLFYIGIILFLIFGKKIPLPSGWIFSKGRKKAFIAADVLIIIIFILCNIFLVDFLLYSSKNFFLLPIGFLTLISFVHLLELYVTNKETKSYYHKCADLAFLLTASILIIIF